MTPSFWLRTGLLGILIYMPAHQAQAGFEWVPPSATMKQAPQVQSMPQVSAPPTSMMAPTPMPAMAMSPVLAEPIAPQIRNNSMRPVTSMPSTAQRQPAPKGFVPREPQPISAPVSAPPTGLYINPYPLQGNSVQPETRGVDISMSERGGALTPVQLGKGMTSGVMAPRMPAVQNAPRQATTANYNQPSMPNDMTPMMGGEPAPMQVDGMPQGIFQGAPQAPVMAVPLSAPRTQYAKAIGFGKKLPLSLALSQVIPSEFSYRFEGEVDTDASVSWEGGQSWDVVLKNMLRTQNLRAFIQGNQVVIAPSASI